MAKHNKTFYRIAVKKTFKENSLALPEANSAFYVLIKKDETALRIEP